MAARIDLQVEAGSTLDRSFVWYEPQLDGDGKVLRDDGGNPLPDRDAPIDLTGLTARMQVRRSVSAAEVMLELTTANGGIILGGTDGRVRLYATPTQTSALESGVYDLELVAAGSPARVERLIKGKVRVSAEVTR